MVTPRILNGIVSILMVAMITACASPDRKLDSLQKADLAVTNVTVIDAVHGRREAVDVVTSGSQILAVGPGVSQQYSARQTVDGTDQYLIPGLWDAHVHLTFTPGVDHQVFFPLALAHGVTSLRDTGGQLELLASARAAAGDPKLLAPDLYISGPLIDGEDRVYDGSRPSLPNLSVGAGNAHEARERVNQLARSGVDFIKAYEMLSPEAYGAVIEAAREAGLPVALHPPLSIGLEGVIAAGGDDIQHLRNVELACATDAVPLQAERSKILENPDSVSGSDLRGMVHRAQRNAALEQQNDQTCIQHIEAMAERGIAQTPTLVVSTFPSERLFAKPYWRATWDLMPADVGSGWRERSAAFLDSKPSADALRYAAWMRQIIPLMRSKNVQFMAGTDAPIGYLTPGASLHEELRLLAEFGLTPIQVLEAATLTPAAFFGIEGKQGTVASGMKADLVLLNQDPLIDIRNIAAIDSVIKEGCVLNRAALDKLLKGPAGTDEYLAPVHCRQTPSD